MPLSDHARRVLSQATSAAIAAGRSHSLAPVLASLRQTPAATLYDWMGLEPHERVRFDLDPVHAELRALLAQYPANAAALDVLQDPAQYADYRAPDGSGEYHYYVPRVASEAEARAAFWAREPHVAVTETCRMDASTWLVIFTPTVPAPC